jgi:hypothetical protein
VLPTRVVDIINGVIFRPEWTFTAEPNDRFENGVAVHVTYEARDWGSKHYPDAWRNGYTEMVPGGARASFLLTCGSFTCPEDVYRALLGIVAKIDSHEAREALRTPDGHAPFHPHNEASMALWGDVTGDLSFGAI